MSYSCSQTIKYKQGFIHTAMVDGYYEVRVQVDATSKAILVKSEQAAKLLITKHYLKKAA